MKTYNLEYEFLGGKTSLQTTNLFDFIQKLDKAMDTPQIAAETINFWVDVHKQPDVPMDRLLKVVNETIEAEPQFEGVLTEFLHKVKAA